MCAEVRFRWADGFVSAFRSMPFWLAVIAAGCAPEAPASPALTIMPREPGILGDLMPGMAYDPETTPLVWASDTTLIVWHAEQKSAADVFRLQCEGTGLFRVTVGHEEPVAVAGGDPLCHVHALLRPAPDPTASHAVASLPDPRAIGVLQWNLTDGSVDTLRSDCDIGQTPAWAADGSFFVFQGSCVLGGTRELGAYLLSADGDSLRRLPLPEERKIGELSLHPDGDRLAYVVYDSGEWPPALYVAEELGRRDVSELEGFAPAWSPDGNWLALMAHPAPSDDGWGIWVVRADGTDARLVWRNEAQTTFQRGWGPRPEGMPVSQPVWSPDGEWIAFSRRFDRGVSVWRVNVRSGAVEQLTERSP